MFTDPSGEIAPLVWGGIVVGGAFGFWSSPNVANAPAPGDKTIPDPGPGGCEPWNGLTGAAVGGAVGGRRRGSAGCSAVAAPYRGELEAGAQWLCRTFPPELILLYAMAVVQVERFSFPEPKLFANKWRARRDSRVTLCTTRWQYLTTRVISSAGHSVLAQSDHAQPRAAQSTATLDPIRCVAQVPLITKDLQNWMLFR